MIMKLFGPMDLIVVLALLIMLTVLRFIRSRVVRLSSLWKNYKLELYI